MIHSVLLANLALISATPAPSVSAFSAAVDTDAASGLKVIVLKYDDAKDPTRSLAARVLPEAGANLFSLKIGDDELMPQPDKLADLKQNKTGTPILFPTPNRVRDASFTWERKTFSFPASSGKNFIHGLVRTRPWSFDPPTATETAATVTTFIDWNAEQPDFARFPIKHRLAVTFTLGKQGVRITYNVDNRDSTRLPFGFALHPYFRIPADRNDVFVRIPVAQRMEAVDKLPTAKLVAVAGSPFDLREPVSLDKLDLDDVYFGLTPSALPAFEWRSQGIRMTLGASKEFTHLVIYTPPGKPFFCMENQTSSTDAHNLFAQGHKKEAHLLVAEPGKSAAGFVDWKISRTKK